MNKIKIYQKAIELLQNAPSSLVLGLCHVITEAILLEQYGMSYKKAQDDSNNTFKEVWELTLDIVGGLRDCTFEIARHKPKNTFSYGFWFHPFDRTSRIEILNKAIVELQGNGYIAD